MKNLVKLSLVPIIFLFSMLTHAQGVPSVAFSDLISGPSEGLNDEQGIGAIVTLWGYNFEASKGQVHVTDSAGVRRPAAHIYYWKAADGTLPGGPSDLFKTHRLYEIAFSLPSSSSGIASIQVESLSGKISDGYEFTVRSGNIYHAKPSGNNSSGDGSFDNPWEFVNGSDSSKPAPGNRGLKAGDILYSHGVREPSQAGGGRDYGMFLRGLDGTLDRQIVISGYPGTQPTVESPRSGVHPYLSTGIVLSKYNVKGGLLDDPMDMSPTFGARLLTDSTIQVKTSENGRIIANFLTDSDGKCSNGWNGAIVSGGLGGSNVKVFGNQITNIGCRQTSHFHHTTYMTKRDTASDAAAQAWEFAYNYLSNNEAKFGIHFYDQSQFNSTNCGDVTGTLQIHNNFIENQRGTGINVRTNDYVGNDDCWSASVEINDNIILNSGLGPVSELNNGTSPHAIDVGGDIGGSILISNNLIFNVSDTSSRLYEKASAIKVGKAGDPEQVLVTRNIVAVDAIGFEIDLINTENEKIEIKDNVFYRKGTSLKDNLDVYFPPFFKPAQNILGNPNLTFSEKSIAYSVPKPSGEINYISRSLDRLGTDFYGQKINNSYIGPINTMVVSSNLTSPPQPPKNIAID